MRQSRARVLTAHRGSRVVMAVPSPPELPSRFPNAPSNAALRMSGVIDAQVFAAVIGSGACA